jgi:hypothetical protein
LRSQSITIVYQTKSITFQYVGQSQLQNGTSVSVAKRSSSQFTLEYYDNNVTVGDLVAIRDQCYTSSGVTFTTTGTVLATTVYQAKSRPSIRKL